MALSHRPWSEPSGSGAPSPKGWFTPAVPARTDEVHTVVVDGESGVFFGEPGGLGEGAFEPR